MILLHVLPSFKDQIYIQNKKNNKKNLKTTNAQNLMIIVDLVGTWYSEF